MTSDHDGVSIPVWRLDTGAMPAGQRFEAWFQAARPFYDVSRLDDADPYPTRATAFLLDNLICTCVAFGRERHERGATHVRRVDPGCLSLQLYLRGHLSGLLGSEAIVMAPGRINLLDWGKEGQVVTSASKVLGMLLPYAALGYDPSRHRAFRSWSIDSPEGRILCDALLSLWRQLPCVTQAEAPALAAAFSGLLRGLLFRGREIEDDGLAETATFLSMQAYVERHLHRRDFDAAHLCQAFRASRSTVYRLFTGVGGVNRYIQKRRLEHSFEDLARSPRTTRVRVVAERWGFDNPSHFHRLFKKTFDATPSEILGSMVEPEPSLSGAQRNQGAVWKAAMPCIGDWITQL